MRIIYLGTPEFAVPTLKALIEDPDFEVVQVVCQPDRPKGRGGKVQAPPVKELALIHGIEVLQPEKLATDKAVVEKMRQAKPDVIVMVAFGQILKKAVLQMAPFGVINLHGSLLPALRGAAPINWAIIRGLKKTGNTTMCTEAGVDTGPILLKNEVTIDTDMDAPALAKTMSETGAVLMVETLKKLKAGDIEPIIQDESLASYAPLMDKQMGEIDWRLPALDIHNLVRGLRPWPGTFSRFRGDVLKVIETSLKDLPDGSGSLLRPGTVVKEKKRILVACSKDGSQRIELVSVQPPNKPKLNSFDWANGIRIEDSLEILSSRENNDE